MAKVTPLSVPRWGRLSNTPTPKEYFDRIIALFTAVLDNNTCVQVNGSPEDEGIIPRAVTDLFKRIEELRAEGVKASVHASFLEVSQSVRR